MSIDFHNCFGDDTWGPSLTGCDRERGGSEMEPAFTVMPLTMLLHLTGIICMDFSNFESVTISTG